MDPIMLILTALAAGAALGDGHCIGGQRRLFRAGGSW
jgi:hypothetical protein